MAELFHQPEARLFFNVTPGVYNATTWATVSGALLFVALNTAFIMYYLAPSAKARAETIKEEEEYYDYDYEAPRKKRRCVVSLNLVILDGPDDDLLLDFAHQFGYRVRSVFEFYIVCV